MQAFTTFTPLTFGILADRAQEGHTCGASRLECLTGPALVLLPVYVRTYTYIYVYRLGTLSTVPIVGVWAGKVDLQSVGVLTSEEPVRAEEQLQRAEDKQPRK